MVWTTPKTWSVGETLTAANFNTHIRDNLNAIFVVPKMKAVDETVSASTTLQNDDDFFFSVGINEKWLVEMSLKVNASAAGDLKWNWTVPAGTTRDHTWSYSNPGANPDWAGTGDGGISSSGSGAEAVHIRAFFLVAGTAGTVQFQWAQTTASGATILKAGSFMTATRIP